ncbi:MAG: hypothetical protein Q9160_006848 [Pyrenula sp. 1 TL-2023]
MRCAFKLWPRRFYASAASSSLTVPIPNRAFIELEGADTVPFLQGLTTNNIKTLNGSSSQWIYTAFLNAQGRILNDAYIWPPADRQARNSWLVEVDARESQSLLRHLKKHKLRSKLQIRLLERNAIRSYSRFRFDSSLKESLADSRIVDSQNKIVEALEELSGDAKTEEVAYPRGSRLLSAQGVEDLISDHDWSRLSRAYHVHRMTNGLPEGQGEIIRESALPQESNMDLLGGIDFRKGCYLGQELTIRTHHTGVVRKRILPVQLYATGEDMPIQPESPVFKRYAMKQSPPTGANISKAGARKGRSAGKWLNGVGNVGLALCRLDMMTDMRLTEEPSQYDPGQEFKVTWEAEGDRSAGEVKLKAFVPQWMRDGILAGFKSNSRQQEPDLEKNMEADLPDSDEELTSPHGAFGVRDSQT